VLGRACPDSGFVEMARQFFDKEALVVGQLGRQASR
jgi:hypothetical protein